MFRWPWKKYGLSEEDRRLTHEHKQDLEVRKEKGAKVHREVAEIIIHNGLGEMFEIAMLPKGRGR